MLLKTVTIESSRFGWGLYPPKGLEDEQRLTINNRGSVYFTAYGWDNGVVVRKERLNIGKDNARRILELLYGFVIDPNAFCEATDVAYWRMSAKTDDGSMYDVSGPMTNWVEYKGENISEVIRKLIPIEDLIVFGEDDDEKVLNIEDYKD